MTPETQWAVCVQQAGSSQVVVYYVEGLSTLDDVLCRTAERYGAVEDESVVCWCKYNTPECVWTELVDMAVDMVDGESNDAAALCYDPPSSSTLRYPW